MLTPLLKEAELPHLTWHHIRHNAGSYLLSDNAACTSATTSTLDMDRAGYYASITIGSDGLGLISYNNDDEDLLVAHCSNTACTSATTTTVDSDGDVGWYTSITIGADGLGLIGYYDSTNDDLKVAHCENAFCSPYFRRR